MTEKTAPQCVPCSAGVPALRGSHLQDLHKGLRDGWSIVDEHHLERAYRFRDFKTALDFTNRVGAVAEEYGHHPDIELSWGRVRLTLWTHKSGGLTESDFALAAQIDRL